MEDNELRERERGLLLELDALRDKVNQIEHEKQDQYIREERVQRQNQQIKTQLESVRKEQEKLLMQIKSLLAEKERLSEECRQRVDM